MREVLQLKAVRWIIRPTPTSGSLNFQISVNGLPRHITGSLGFDVHEVLAPDERQATFGATAVSLMPPTSLDATMLHHNRPLRSDEEHNCPHVRSMPGTRPLHPYHDANLAGTKAPSMSFPPHWWFGAFAALHPPVYNMRPGIKSLNKDLARTRQQLADK